MKAVYSCDHCNFTTSDLEAMEKHEAAHKDAEILANRINALIAEYNNKHDETFYIAKYTPSPVNKKKAEKPPVKNTAENRDIFPSLTEIRGRDIPDVFTVLLNSLGGRD